MLGISYRIKCLALLGQWNVRGTSGFMWLNFYFSNIKLRLQSWVKKSGFVSVINVDELNMYSDEDINKDINRSLL
jgi:hypothetical protein